MPNIPMALLEGRHVQEKKKYFVYGIKKRKELSTCIL